MQSMHCLDCGGESHPRLRHPSSLRTEASVWAVAIVIGLSVGAWQAITTSDGGGVPAISSLSAVAPAAGEAVPAVQSHEAPRNVVVQVGSWLVTRMIEFLKVAWWALPIPLVFSLWRHRSKHPVCVHCGSRQLVPAEPVYPSLSG
jgi:hypothetical protein